MHETIHEFDTKLHIWKGIKFDMWQNSHTPFFLSFRTYINARKLQYKDNVHPTNMYKIDNVMSSKMALQFVSHCTQATIQLASHPWPFLSMSGCLLLSEWRLLRNSIGQIIHSVLWSLKPHWIHSGKTYLYQFKEVISKDSLTEDSVRVVTEKVS